MFWSLPYVVHRLSVITLRQRRKRITRSAHRNSKPMTFLDGFVQTAGPCAVAKMLRFCPTNEHTSTGQLGLPAICAGRASESGQELISFTSLGHPLVTSVSDDGGVHAKRNRVWVAKG